MRNVRTLLAWTMLLTAVILQGTLAGQVRLAGYLPDLVLTTVLCLGLVTGPYYGAVFGFSGGALQSILVSESPGSFMVSRTLAALVLGVVGVRLFRGNWVAPLLLLFVGTLLAEFIFFLMTPTTGFRHCLHLALAEGVWSVLFGVFLYPLTQRWLIR